MSVARKIDVQYPLPRHAEGVIRFGDDKRLKQPDVFLRSLRQVRWLWDDLQEETRTVSWLHEDKRIPGEWTLVYLLFVISGHVDVKFWFDRTEESLWERAGFPRVPHGDSVQEHFARLEPLRPAFTRAAGKVMRRMTERWPQFRQYEHTDASPVHTAARLEHWCAPGTCPTGHSGQQLGSFADAPRAQPKGRIESAARNLLPKRITPEMATERKQDALEAGDQSIDTRTVEGLAGEVLAGPGIEHGRIDPDGHLVWRIDSGNVLRIRDRWGGAKMYGGGGGRVREAWSGHASMKSTEHLFWLVTGISTYSCSHNEPSQLPGHLDRIRENTGKVEKAQTLDAGGAIRSFIEGQTKLGVAVVHHAARQDRPPDRR